MQTTSTDRRQTNKSLQARSFGAAQLTLVEHSLCPLNERDSLQSNRQHTVSYWYTDPATQKRKRANVRVTAPIGYSSKDDHLLWTLLSITLNQQNPDPELWVTQDYVNRMMGFQQRSERGGWRSLCFRDGLKRLSYLIYDADAFYLPDRHEYRSVVMGVLKFDRPLDIKSKRPWCIRWDATFFKLCTNTSGRFFFDMQTYRDLDFAQRRAFLLLLKIHAKGRRSPRFDVTDFAVNVLGYQPGMPLKKYKERVARCLNELLVRGVVGLPAGCPNVAALFRKDATGKWTFIAPPGKQFATEPSQPKLSSSGCLEDSPSHDPLKQVGFSDAEIEAICNRYDSKSIVKAADITLRVMEGGTGVPVIRKHPKAFCRYYLNALSKKKHTVPDWYTECVEHDQRQRTQQTLRDASDEYQRAYEEELNRFLKEQTSSERYEHLVQVFLANHQSDAGSQSATAIAERDAAAQLRREFEFPEESVWLRQHYDSAA